MKTSGSPLRIVTAALVALALIAAVSATSAYAGAKWINGKDIKKHSIPANRLKGVDAKQIDGKIKGKQLGKGSVTGNRIAKRTIEAAQIADETITTNELSDGTVEELQPTVEYVDNVFTVNFAEDKQVAAPCPTGTQAVGGYVKSGGYAPASSTSFVDQAQNAFVIRIATAETTSQVTVQTICLR